MKTKAEREETRTIGALPDMKTLTLHLLLKLLKADQYEIEIGKIAEELQVEQKYILKATAPLDEENIVVRTRDLSAIIVPKGEERLRLAVMAVTLGASIEESTGALSWKEFEAFCMNVFETNGYLCTHGFRFKSTRGRRYECDVLGLNKPMILLADCKHYGRKVAGLREAVKKQLERVGALSKSIPAIIRRIPQIAGWEEGIIVPVIVTLLPENIAIIEGVPIVPAFKLNQFIQELPSNIESVTNITVRPSRQGKLI